MAQRQPLQTESKSDSEILEALERAEELRDQTYILNDDLDYFLNPYLPSFEQPLDAKNDIQTHESSIKYTLIDGPTEFQHDYCIPMIPFTTKGPSSILSHYWLGENSCCVSLSPEYEGQWRRGPRYALATQWALNAPMRLLYRTAYHLCGTSSENPQWRIWGDRLASIGLCLVRIPYSLVTCSFICCAGVIGVAGPCSLKPERQDMDSAIVDQAKDAAISDFRDFFQMFLDSKEVREKLDSHFYVDSILKFMFNRKNEIPIVKKKQALIYLNERGHHNEFDSYLPVLLNFTPENNDLLEFMLSHSMIILSKKTIEEIIFQLDGCYFHSRIPVNVARKTADILARWGVLTLYHQDAVQEAKRNLTLQKVFRLFPSRDVVNLISQYTNVESILPNERNELAAKRREFNVRNAERIKPLDLGLASHREELVAATEYLKK